MEKLKDKKCEPCEGKTAAMTKDQAQSFLKQVPGWLLEADGKSIVREYSMKNFMTAVQLINKVAEVAEAQGHHPDIHLTGYRRLQIDLSTHKIGGLSESDFIMAAKINELPAELKG